MPFVDSSGGRIHYRIDVSPDAPSDAPYVVLSNSLGTNLSMWDPQLTPLLRSFRVLRYDTRGMGQSAVTPGPYTNEQLSADILALLDSLQIDRVHFCGLSMGGMAGMRLGVAAPARIDKLVLCSTAPRIGTAETWKARIDTARSQGMGPVADAVIGRWFTPQFAAGNPSMVESVRRMVAGCTPEGYIACAEAVRDTDETATIGGIRARTLVVSGRHDPSTTPSDGRFIASKIPGAEFIELGGSHLSNIECAAEFNEALIGFVSSP